MRISDWSSDVCSSDLTHAEQNDHQYHARGSAGPDPRRRVLQLHEEIAHEESFPVTRAIEPAHACAGLSPAARTRQDGAEGLSLRLRDGTRRDRTRAVTGTRG